MNLKHLILPVLLASSVAQARVPEPEVPAIVFWGDSFALQDYLSVSGLGLTQCPSSTLFEPGLPWEAWEGEGISRVYEAVREAPGPVLVWTSYGIIDLVLGDEPKVVAWRIADVVQTIQRIRPDVTVLHLGYGTPEFDRGMERMLRRLRKEVRRRDVDKSRYTYSRLGKLAPILFPGVDGIHLSGYASRLRIEWIFANTVASAFRCAPDVEQ